MNSMKLHRETWIAPVLSQVRSFSIPNSSAMMNIDRDGNRRRDVLKNISLLVTRLRGLNVLDVTQSNSYVMTSIILKETDRVTIAFARLGYCIRSLS